MNVLGWVPTEALRRVLDDNRRSLDAEVSGAAFFGRAAPRKPGFRDVLFYLVHLRFRRSVMHNAGPFTGQVEQHLALFLGQGRASDALGLDRLSIAARAEHEVVHLETKNGLLALGFVERV